MPYEGVYIYPYVPHSVIPSHRSPKSRLIWQLTLFTQTLPIQSLEKEKEHERNNVDSMMQTKKDKTQQKVNWIEKMLKAIEGNSSIKGMDSLEQSLVSDVVIAYKFKIPDFVKYNGSTYPKAHMTMFCWKMVEHTGNDKML